MPYLPTHARQPIQNVRRLVGALALCCLANAQSGFATGDPVTCKQLKSLGYLEAQVRVLESDPTLQARLGEVVETDIQGKLERQPDLAKCIEPAPSTRGPSAALSGSPGRSISSRGSGVAGSYFFAGTIVALWGLFVTR